MIDLQAFASTPIRSDPFQWALVEQAIPPADAELLLAEFPAEDFWVISDDDGEKSYTYAARPLVTIGSDRPAALSLPSPAWDQLAQSLLSPEHRATLSDLIGRSLDDALMEASVWRWDAGMQLGPHLDMASKIVTQVFYLSSRWDPTWGGCLRILGSRDPDDIVAELPPTNGSASVLVRSESSWHSVAPVGDGAPEPRRSVIVTWFEPGSTSPVWAVDGDKISCVARGSVRERPRVNQPARLRVPRGTAMTPLSGPRPAKAAFNGGLTVADSTVTTQVAMVGTFDVANFGDLLLPLIAARELRARLGDGVALTLYTYRQMTGSSWPYETRNLAQLGHEISDFDVVLVGGGQIVRFDTDFPAGYLPSDASVHHPLGLWLTPTLIAAAAGIPVAWNAPGVAADIPEWLDPLIDAAVHSASHVVVRDELSARLLAGHAPAGEIRVVPDTAFGIGGLLEEAPSETFSRLAAELGLGNGYVVLQPSSELLPYREGLLRVIDAARGLGLVVLELPLSPIHGDQPGMLGAIGETVTPEHWPEPLLLAELIARADGVIAQSFHAGVVAAAAGVPLFRPPSPSGWKYEALDGLPGVQPLAADGDPFAGELEFGPLPLPGADDRRAQLVSHWDTVAALARQGENAPPGRTAGLVERLPALIADTANDTLARLGELEARREALETALARERVAPLERIARLETDVATLLAERDAQAARGDELQHQLATTRARLAALEIVRNRRIVRLVLALGRALRR
jgi:Polysaccharide pyruvyl transferase/2OG-Fe(II) oxygenase superfamily